jgi:ribonuclease HI
MIEAWFDGATEPVNPGGHSAWGAAVRVDGQFVFREGGYVGFGPKMSNNVAEYAAFMEAVSQCLKYPGPVVIRGDSKLVINQMNRKWRAKAGLYKPFYEQARLLWAKLAPRARLEWVPRERNEVCDGLSKGVLLARGIAFRIQPHAGAPQTDQKNSFFSAKPRPSNPNFCEQHTKL